MGTLHEDPCVVLCALQTKFANHQLGCKKVSDSVVQKNYRFLVQNFYSF